MATNATGHDRRSSRSVMIGEGSPVSIRSRDYWFKIVDFLQHNWALVDTIAEGTTIWFLGDTSGVFDKIECPSARDAEVALLRNGFRRFAGDADASKTMTPPAPPFHQQPHPNGPIYSNGRFWK
jgi:hypothetical protein